MFMSVLDLDAQMSQTPHNLSDIVNQSYDNNQMCVFCHTPHAAEQTVDTPLWNKSLPDTQFSMYGETIAGSHTSNNPNSYSMVCLSCHDGASSINSVVNAPGSGGINQNGADMGLAPILMRPSRNLAIGLNGDLKDDHPVSILYIPGKAGLRPISEPLIGEWKGATYISDLLRNGRVECGSCHDPHYADPNGIFLRNSNEHSQMCLSCHDK